MNRGGESTDKTPSSHMLLTTESYNFDLLAFGCFTISFYCQDL